MSEPLDTFTFEVKMEEFAYLDGFPKGCTNPPPTLAAVQSGNGYFISDELASFSSAECYKVIGIAYLIEDSINWSFEKWDEENNMRVKDSFVGIKK